jgi:hypothetical protein
MMIIVNSINSILRDIFVALLTITFFWWLT